MIGEGFAEGGDGEFVTFSGLVEFGEHEFVGEAPVCGDDGMGSRSPIGRDVPSQCPAPMASVCSLVPWRMGRLMPSFG